MSCKTQIRKVLESAKRHMALHEIQKAIFKRFRVMHETTAISARIRGDVRPEVRKSGFDVMSKRMADKCAHVYWLAKMPKQRGGFKA